MKTIFITSFHPIISRNILGTPLLDLLLKEEDVQLVIIGRDKKADFFRGQFGRNRIIIQGIHTKRNRTDHFLQYLAFSAVDSESLRIKRLTEMKGRGSLFFRFLTNPVGRAFVRFLTKLLVHDGQVEALFEKYKPDLVFSTDIQNDFDVRFILEAQKRKVRNVGMIRSWDNPASKGLIRVLSNRFIVHNRVVEKELKDLHGIQQTPIDVVGIPHYDRYAGSLMSREEAAKKMGLDPRRKVALFVPVGDRYIESNTVDRDVLAFLDTALPPEWNILVRLPFSDSVSFLDDRKSEGRVIFDRPVPHFELLKNNELSTADEERLVATLTLVDIVVSGPSTIVVDAAFFDKPVILIAFDGEEKRNELKSVVRYFKYTHWQPVLKSGGVCFARTKEQAKKCLDEYVRDSSKDKDGRKRIVEAECFSRDGKSSERLAEVLLTELND